MAPPEVSAAQVVVAGDQWDEYSGRIEGIQKRRTASPCIWVSRERELSGRSGGETRRCAVHYRCPQLPRRTGAGNAQFARATSVAAQSCNEARRAKVLVAQHAISTELWEQRNAADKAARADMMAAQAAVDTAQLNLEGPGTRTDCRSGRACAGDQGNPLRQTALRAC